MAVVTATITPTTGITEQWSVPPPAKLSELPVPRGLFTARGSVAIAAKIAANETRVVSTITFPASFGFILRNMMVTIFSDDQVMDFDGVGFVNYATTATSATIYNDQLVSEGIAHQGGSLAALRTYNLAPNYTRTILDGDTMTVTVSVADVSTDASTAGDAFLYADFLVYDKDQIRNWPVNSPLPRFSY